MKPIHAAIFCMFTALFVASVVLYRQKQREDSGPAAEVKVENDGLLDVAWEEMRDVQPFSLTERSGKTFESSSLDNRAYVVSFFFASCPDICKTQNRHIKSAMEKLEDVDVTFVSITCDPSNDTPAKLREYAKSFAADEEKWLFLTGPLEDIYNIGRESFMVSVEKGTHASNFLLVDKYGKFRDRFSWDDPKDLSRFYEVVEDVSSETKPPEGETLFTRAIPKFEEKVSAKYDHGDWKDQDWIKEFELTDQNGKKFSSKELLGEVWVGSFFFTRCPTTCFEQNKKIEALSKTLPDTKFVSISSDPDFDSVAVNKTYSKKFKFDSSRWWFLTGEPLHIRRIGSEFFSVAVPEDADLHSTEFILIDKWGNSRGKYPWQDQAEMIAMRKRMNELARETEKPTEEELAAEKVGKIEDKDEDGLPD